MNAFTASLGKARGRVKKKKKDRCERQGRNGTGTKKERRVCRAYCHMGPWVPVRPQERWTQWNWISLFFSLCLAGMTGKVNRKTLLLSVDFIVKMAYHVHDRSPRRCASRREQNENLCKKAEGAHLNRPLGPCQIAALVISHGSETSGRSSEDSDRHVSSMASDKARPARVSHKSSGLSVSAALGWTPHTRATSKRRSA